MKIIIGFLIGVIVTNLIVSVTSENLIGTIGAIIALVVSLLIIRGMQ